jgi:hypothetical protein
MIWIEVAVEANNMQLDNKTLYLLVDLELDRNIQVYL